MRVWLFTVILVGLGGTAIADEPVDSAAIQGFYPSMLTEVAARDHYVERRQQAFAELRGAGDTRFVVSAYSNGQIGAVVLLERTSKGGLSVDQTICRPFQGDSPEVVARDLDGDGLPEAIVAFMLPRGGAQTWIYRIADRKLQLISPVNKQGGTLLTYPSIVAFDGNGMLDLIEEAVFGTRRDFRVEHEHYTLRGGKYVAAGSLDFYHVFYDQAPSSKPEVIQFAIPQSQLSKPFRLVVLNGDASGPSCRTSKADILLNGIKVASADDFSKHRESWIIPVVLQQQNTLSVALQRGEDEGKGERDGDNHDKCGRVGLAIRHD